MCRFGQAAVAAHEQQALRLHDRPRVVLRVGEGALELRHVAHQQGRQVGVGHRRIAATGETGQGEYVARDAHVIEAHGAGNFGGGPLVLRMAVAVEEDDGGAAHAIVEGALQGPL